MLRDNRRQRAWDNVANLNGGLSMAQRRLLRCDIVFLGTYQMLLSSGQVRVEITR